jgi:hypothetical protein
VPGAGVCRKFFSEQECWYSEFSSADYYRGTVLSNDLGSVLPEEKNDKLIDLVISKILEHPFQYIFFMFIESARMPFWESTQIGFVDYPPWLNKIYQNNMAKDMLRLFISVLTIAALIFFSWDVFSRRKLLTINSREGENLQVRFFSFLIIIAFMFLHSFFSVITRYSFPIVHLYVLSIACLVDSLFFVMKERKGIC